MARKKTVEPAVETTEVTEAEVMENKAEDIKAEEAVAEEAAKPKKASGRKTASTKKEVSKATKATRTAKNAKVVEKEPAKEETVEAAPVKEDAVTEAPKAAKKESTKKVTARGGEKEAAQKNTLHIQYAGKSLSQEDLLKSARDIWEYDLKHKPEELNSIELYVKPEENMVYYVMNEEIKGSFAI